jgi:predicted permease
VRGPFFYVPDKISCAARGCVAETVSRGNVRVSSRASVQRVQGTGIDASHCPYSQSTEWDTNLNLISRTASRVRVSNTGRQADGRARKSNVRTSASPRVYYFREGHVIAEIRYAIRSLLKEKGFAFTVVVTLAICIAANTATFAIVNAVLLRPLPVPDANSILLMSNRYPKAGVDFSFSSGGDYYDRRADVTALKEQAMFQFEDQSIGIDGTPEQVPGMVATPSLFRLLEIAPALGRTFNEDEGEIGAEQKVILSHGLWQSLYGGSQKALGQELRLSGRTYRIVGVMPASFSFVKPEVRFWIPLAFSAQEKTAHHRNNYYSIGRLKPGTSVQQVQAQVDALNARNLDRFPEFKEILINAGFHTVVEPLQNMMVKEVRHTLYLLWSGAIFVLLIGAVNITNLALARLAVRRKELATRLALGAGRARILRQLVMDNLLLAVAGGAAGVGLGAALVRALASVGLDKFPRAAEVSVDGRVILVAMMTAIFTGAAIGLIPLTDVFNVSLNSMMHESSRTGTGGRRVRRVRQGLVTAQIAFAFSLLMGAALLLVSFRQLLRVDPGFQTKRILTASTNMPRSRYSGDPQLREFMSGSLGAIRRTPGVVAAGATSTIPFAGIYNDGVILAEGYMMKPGESVISPRQAEATPGYFDTMGIALVKGRYFEDRDDANSPRVVIVDERLAHRFWPNRDPIGQRMFQPQDPKALLKTDEHTRWLTVVGVVRSIRLNDLAGTGSPVGAYYFPYAQSPDRSFTFSIKTAGAPGAVARDVRAAIARIDRELPLFDIRTMSERAELTLASRRTSLLLAIGFGAVALFLSAIGIYGVLAFLVTQRRREIGIRVALGSTEYGVVKLVLREGLVLVGAGLVLGIAGAVALSRVVASEIYGVKPLDPVLMATVTAMLGAVALAACVVPARRALGVDPIVVLSE